MKDGLPIGERLGIGALFKSFTRKNVSSTDVSLVDSTVMNSSSELNDKLFIVDPLGTDFFFHPDAGSYDPPPIIGELDSGDRIGTFVDSERSSLTWRATR